MIKFVIIIDIKTMNIITFTIMSIYGDKLNFTAKRTTKMSVIIQAYKERYMFIL